MVLSSCGVLVLSLYLRLRLVCSCLMVIVVTDSHLHSSLLYHSCLSSIVETALSAIVVNLLWLWALYKETILAYIVVSRSRLLLFLSCRMSSHPFLCSKVLESLGPRCFVFVWELSVVNRRGKGTKTEIDEHQAHRALRCKLLFFSFSLVRDPCGLARTTHTRILVTPLE